MHFLVYSVGMSGFRTAKHLFNLWIVLVLSLARSTVLASIFIWFIQILAQDVCCKFLLSFAYHLSYSFSQEGCVFDKSSVPIFMARVFSVLSKQYWLAPRL